MKRCGSTFITVPTYIITGRCMLRLYMRLMHEKLRIFLMIKLTREQANGIRVMSIPAERMKLAGNLTELQ